MSDQDRYIPLRSVTLMPRWAYVTTAAVCWLAIAAGVALVIWGALGADPGRIGGGIGGGLGCMIGGLGALYGTRRDWLRRPDPLMLLRHLQGSSIVPQAKVWMWAGVVLAAVGLAFWLAGAPGARTPLFMGLVWIWVGIVLRAMHAHLLRRARAVFTLYAEGLLAPEEAAAIDDARARDEGFDRRVREFQQLNDQVRDLGTVSGPDPFAPGESGGGR
jgi:hypothetical protein